MPSNPYQSRRRLLWQAAIPVLTAIFVIAISPTILDRAGPVVGWTTIGLVMASVVAVFVLRVRNLRR